MMLIVVVGSSMLGRAEWGSFSTHPNPCSLQFG